MESKGGCCIASRFYDMTKVDRIMLRFRPIAPKPANGGGGGGGGSVSPRESSAEGYCKLGRGKRRQSKESNNAKRRKKVSSEEKRVTLPLISETPDCKYFIPMENKRNTAAKATEAPFWLSFGEAADGDKKLSFSFLGSGGDCDSVDRVVRSSCVTVECVTDTWVSGDGLGCTDEERKVNLGKDTCPGFISDLFGRVTWTNGAYKEMVGGETTVRLLTKQRLPPAMAFPAFTCRVRVQYVCGKDMNSLTVPCDVWRMNGGGFAWRLDIKAALCLGR
ncbi:Dynamic Influencer of Gene expression 2, ABA-induced transcription repressor 5 [Hibiscus trionum]|uniref:Dynamic Influencer of Gene expression 2, ABA-induced transcription repressor 5 n=1 Tax=Hibiscus trionum TaxID=183268 RepID=A0A9W7LVJ6_HIBTR|nr:Dynamic Influencer of Gene expression 2, ABA-induced transcription repressor 5 [Hibiscus trionum]